MRHNQNRRSRGRSRKGPNPLTRSYESNGPDVKVRGNAAHVAEKYMSLARDAQVSGDVVAAENYLQHAEHYNRIVMAAQSQFQQSQPQFREGGGDEGYDDDRQMNGRGVRDRFAYNGEGRGDDEGDERIESESEGEDDRGFRQARDDRGSAARATATSAMTARTSATTATAPPSASKIRTSRSPRCRSRRKLPLPTSRRASRAVGAGGRVARTPSPHRRAKKPPTARRRWRRFLNSTAPQ